MACLWHVVNLEKDEEIDDEKARRGYAFMYGNADDWDVIRDCHKKSMREAKGKFKPAGAGFTMDRDKVCGDY